MKRIARALAFSVVVVGISTEFPGEPIVFRLASDGGTAGNEWIVADGEFTPTTPDDFVAFLKANNIKIGARYEVYLNSPGGSLFAGVKLGEIIRNYRFGTRVASTIPLNIGGGPFKFETDGPGFCASACSFAFLGGKWRIAADRTVGVHQHYMDAALKDAQAKAFSAVDMSEQQAVEGILADYIVRMGVDARFLTRASMSAPTEIYAFSTDEMKRFSITWNDLEYSDWSLEPYKDGIIAVSKTLNLENTATLFCRKDRILRLLISSPARSNPDEAIKSITDNPMVNLYGTDIPKENISARFEQKTIKIEFKLPIGMSAETPKSTLYVTGTKLEGMTAVGANRFWFYHALPDRNFDQMLKLVSRNCI